MKKAWQVYHITWVTHNSRVSERMVEFGVKHGEPLILDDEQEKEITAYILQIVKEDNLRVLGYNICRDHVHMILAVGWAAPTLPVGRQATAAGIGCKTNHGVGAIPALFVSYLQFPFDKLEKG